MINWSMGIASLPGTSVFQSSVSMHVCVCTHISCVAVATHSLSLSACSSQMKLKLSPVSFDHAVTHDFVHYRKMKSICKDLAWEVWDTGYLGSMAFSRHLLKLYLFFRELGVNIWWTECQKKWRKMDRIIKKIMWLWLLLFPCLFPPSPFCLSQPLQVYFLRGLQFLLLAWVPPLMYFPP